MMTFLNTSPRCLSDRELITRVRELACRERQATACLVAHLAELDERRLYLAEGCATLFAYCTEILHLSEAAAFSRIMAARAARKFPIVLERLADGSVHLTSVRLLAGHLTEDNHLDLLDRAAHRSKRQVEEIVAAIRPKPAAAAVVRRVGGHSTPRDEQPATTLDFGASAPAGGSAKQEDLAESRPSPAAGRPAILDDRGSNVAPAAPKPHQASAVPLSPESYRLQCTITSATHQKLRQARELLRHRIPDGDIAAVLDLALNMLVDKLAEERFGKPGRSRPSKSVSAQRPQRRGCHGEPARSGGRQGPDASEHSPRECLELINHETKSGETRAPVAVPRAGRSKASRYIPKHTRRHVWNRDGGRCAFIADNGRRCSERGRLEFHHVNPFARGGPSTAENLQLRCRAHNAHEAEAIFGAGWRQPVPEQVASASSHGD